MLGIKIIIYTFIFLTTSLIGILKSKKYVYRVEELREFKVALNIFKTKLIFTKEPIQEIFEEIAENSTQNVGNVFKIANKIMENESAEKSWNMAIELSILNITEEDKSILKNMGNLLGMTDVEGQINQIELTEKFLEEQIIKGEKEKQKNEKLYRTLGMTAGLGIVIILI